MVSSCSCFVDTIELGPIPFASGDALVVTTHLAHSVITYIPLGMPYPARLAVLDPVYFFVPGVYRRAVYGLVRPWLMSVRFGEVVASDIFYVGDSFILAA